MSDVFGLTTISGTNDVATLLVDSVGQSVCVVNNDPVNTIYLGDNNAIAYTDQQVTPLGPLNAVTFDGSEQIFGITEPTITVAALLFPGGSNWQPSPIQVQEQIAALGLATLDEQINQNTAIPVNISTTGAPLLNLYDLLADGTNVAVGSGDAVTLPATGNYVITQIAYEFSLELLTAQDAVAAPVTVNFQWTDSDSGLITAVQNYGIYAAYNSGVPHTIEGHGPSDADELQVQIYSPDAAITFSFTLLQSSRNYLRHEWRTQTPASADITFPTMTYVSCVPAANILASEATGSLASGGSVSYLLPFFVGSASLWFNTAEETTGGAALLQDSIRALSSSTMQRWKSASNGDQSPTPIILPRDQCIMELQNGTADTSAMTLGIIAQELQTS